ncbi:hypothetical protein Poli38472_004092 [Pythium oligandrum]|uniref:D-serine dehydratase n=1 Tax=Pythium oligandrum TaxID=41045 RepID=A0A8K1CPM8_PYTOL|nr:hypothetical protein Poli38472_004092 [Pythium oligandrum]|eukprot:TMW66327.1 hypothetical protein Poli38472_004092 [Pythium oligandrum]
MSLWMTTPSVVVDAQRVRRNVDNMQSIAQTHGVNLRPHVKTHKTLEIASMQLEAGACGLTVSKPSEALKFFQSGLSQLTSILLAYPVVQTDKIAKLLEAATQTGIEFRITIDSVEGINAVERAAAASGYSPLVLIHIDVGYHRVGLEEDDSRILEFAQRLHESKSVQFAGILSHAGHAYGCSSVDECAAVAETERSIMVRIKSAIESLGVPVPTVSVGSTLTELARKNFEGVTEIRPGNYVFLDRTPVRMGLASVMDVSLSILVTVVSTNHRYFIVDSGSKVLSSDAPRATQKNTFGTSCYGLAFLEKDFALLNEEPSAHESVTLDGHQIHCWEVKKLSEEHGWLQQVEGMPAPAIGERMVILPNHSCVVANLTDNLFVQGEHPMTWKTVSRGCSQ